MDHLQKSPPESTLKDMFMLFKAWGNYLKSRRGLILLISILTGILAVGYAYVKKPAYTASTTFVLENSEGGKGALGQYLGLASMVGIDFGGSGGVFQGDNILELYKSRHMISQALLSPVSASSKKLLIERFMEINGWDAQWGVTGDNLNRYQDSLLNGAIKKINEKYLQVGKPNQRIDVIRVEVTAKDEAFAKVFNEQLVQKVNDFYIQTKTKKALDNVAILQFKTDSVRSVMNGAIFEAAKINDATPNLNPTRQLQRTAPVQRSQFSAETNKAVLEELLKNLELAKISLRKETPLIQVIDSPVYPLKKEKIYLSVYGLLAFGLAFLFTSVILLLRKTILEKLD